MTTPTLEQQIIDLTAQLEASRQETAKAQAQATRIARQNTLAQIRQQHAIHFISGVSPEILTAAFENAFQHIENLADAPQVAAALNTFRQANSALILDTTGAGTGQPPKTTPAEPTPQNIARILADAKIIK